jgi:cation-transporting P-type ATPase D
VEDESLGSILSDTALIALARSDPSTPELICATIAAADASPEVQEAVTGSKIPHFASTSPIVLKDVSDLHKVIQSSIDVEVDETILQKGPLTYSLSWLTEKLISMFKSSGSTVLDYSHEYRLIVNSSVHETAKRQKVGTAEKSRIQFVKKFSCKAPIYHNCRIYADDGRLLCFCDRKKLDW